MKALGCITSPQLAIFKGIAEGKLELALGYICLGMASWEQVRLAFEAGEVMEKGFKGIRKDGGAKGDEFKIELASTGHAGYQHKSCKTSGIKTDKGQPRVGKLGGYDGHPTWRYTH